MFKKIKYSIYYKNLTDYCLLFAFMKSPWINFEMFSNYPFSGFGIVLVQPQLNSVSESVDLKPNFMYRINYDFGRSQFANFVELLTSVLPLKDLLGPWARFMLFRFRGFESSPPPYFILLQISISARMKLKNWQTNFDSFLNNSLTSKTTIQKWLGSF